jgi:predicted RNase H-like HicB family nuclease
VLQPGPGVTPLSSDIVKRLTRTWWYPVDRESREAVAKTYTAVVERHPETHLYVGYIPGFPGAHNHAASLDELNDNLREVISLLTEEGEPDLRRTPPE